MFGGPVTTVIPVTDATQVGDARRTVAELASRAELDENERGRLALVVTEAATNLAKHAREGLLYCRILGRPAETASGREYEPGGVEIIALDRGPGIANLSLVMEDGYSTHGTSGHGLGAIRRLASEFDIFSLPAPSPNPGTIVAARVWAEHSAPADADRCVGAVCIPFSGENACGDAWSVYRTASGRFLMMVADGLGHGQDAAAAAIRATGLFREVLTTKPQTLVHDMLALTHEALRSTRGAAIGIAAVEGRSLSYAGVGNIVASVLSDGRTQGLMSHDGIVGLRIRDPQPLAYAWPEQARLMMHSDGVSARWRPDNYPGLMRRHPSIIAAAIFRDCARARDDATAVVLSS